MALDFLAAAGNWPLKMSYRDGTTGGFLSRAFGDSPLPSLGVTLDFGSASGQANKGYIAKRTLGATSYDLIDLNGALNDGLTNTFSPTNLKLAAIGIVSPDGTKSLRAGPQGQSNPFVGPWGGSGATVYKKFTHWDLLVYEPVVGYTVTPGTGDILPIYNPGATSLDYWIFLAGT